MTAIGDVARSTLSTRTEIDGERIGVVGYRMGGMMTVILAAIEPRLAACVACVPPVVRDAYSAIAIDAFAPRIRQPFLLQVATDEGGGGSTWERGSQNTPAT